MHLSVRQGDLTHTPLEAHSADLVTLHQVLHYLHDPIEAITEAARLLIPGGTLIIVDYEAHDRDEYRVKYNHRRLGFADTDIKNWLTRAGFSLTDSQQIKSDADLPGVKVWCGMRNQEEALAWREH